MSEGASTAPVGHWTQALARALEGGIGGYQMGQANRDEEAGQAASADLLARALQGGDNTTMTQAMSDPYMPEYGQRMLAQQWEQNNVADDPMADLERRYKEAQIAQMQANIDKMNSPDARARFGLNPQYGVDAQGNPVLLQLGENGAAVQTQMPDGVRLSKEPIKLDAGTHFILLDPITRQPVGQIPKDVAGEAAAQALGKEQGTATATLPAAKITAEQTMGNIDQLLADPNLSSVSGVESYLPDMAIGTFSPATLGLRRRVEQLKGSAFLEAYNGLRGGGQITEVEGKKAEQALARLDTAQTDQDFVTALKDFQDAVRTGYAKLAARAGGNAPPITGVPPQVRRRYNPATGQLE